MDYSYEGRVLKIADAHAHIYPERIAIKASASVGSFYGAPMKNIGYPHTLLEKGNEIGVRRYLVCSVATRPEQTAAINTFISQKCAAYPQFLGFATLHPHQPDWERELERVGELGLRGVKFHPDFQQFYIDDPAMMPIYRRISAYHLPVLFHMGDERYDYSAPHRLFHVLQALPDLQCIAAHFGGYRCWDEAAKYLTAPTLFYDTSSSLWKLTPQEAVDLIHHFGAERMMFGTDFPMWDHKTELERFLALHLSPPETDAILGQNFERFFGVKL